MQRLTSRWWLAVACAMLALASSVSHAALFEDDEARRAILEMRQRIDQMQQSNQRTGDDSAQLRRSLLDLQAQISEAEEQIQYARRYFNGTVRELNILVDAFPSNLVARLFGFAPMEYFEIELATQRLSPELPFK